MPRNELLIDIRVNVLGWTQTRLAREVGVSVRTVKDWESSKVTRPQPTLLEQLIKVTGVRTAAELGFGPSALSRPRGTVRSGGTGQKGSDDVLLRRDLLVIVSSAMGGALAEPVAKLFPAPTDSARVGAADVEQVNLLRTYSYNLERIMGGGALNAAALIRQYRTTLGTLHGTYRSATVRRDMHEAVAHYGTVAGWSLVDQGEHASAQRVFTAALAATEGAPADRKDPLRALILTCMARQSIYLRDYRTAVELLDHLDASVRDLPADVRAITRTRRARALAGLGDVHTVTELTERAADEFGSSAQNSAAEYQDNGFGIDELSSDIGHAYSSLAIDYGLRSTEASRRLTDSINSYGDTDSRSRALAGIRLVNVHLAQRDGQRALEAAQRHATEARMVRSTQIHEHTETGLRLAARHHTDPGVAEVITILRDIRRPA
ncbi:MAG TPA: helix-turn-helix transcriptional regulator [Mycobacteriales bacterium]|nr:helix-turn-helix transcriptional regulator [Mycobacteriales bacterium]